MRGLRAPIEDDGDEDICMLKTWSASVSSQHRYATYLLADRRSRALRSPGKYTCNTTPNEYPSATRSVDKADSNVPDSAQCQGGQTRRVLVAERGWDEKREEKRRWDGMSEYSAPWAPYIRSWVGLYVRRKHKWK